MRVLLVGAALLALSVAAPVAQTTAPDRAVQPVAATLSDEQIERFLREAKIVTTRSIGKGVTDSVRATLTDGSITHDAQIQSIEEKKARFEARNSTEFNFEDSWRFNVAAYRLDRLLDLRMVPPSVRRNWRSKPAAFTWWIDDVMMDEGARLKSNSVAPDSAAWNEQMQMVRLFDQLIYNVDRNMGNLLIGTTWRIWAIDHTRAFRTYSSLKTPAAVRRCEREVLARLRQLDRTTLKREIGSFVADYQINSLLDRRDQIVQIIDKAGPAGVFDRRSY